MKERKAVGIWIRVSTEDQALGDSPEHHEKRARMYAEAKDWEVITVYHLEAVSGKAVMHHPEAQRMLKDIQNGAISGLIFSGIARLARSTRELLDFADHFQKHGADLISLKESIDTSTPAGRLFYTVIAAMAQWEREEIAARVAASVPIRAKLGKPLGGAAPFGYEWQGEKGQVKKFVLDIKEAPVRKLMYEIFLRTKRKKATARELNNLGYRTRNGSMFTGTTIGRLLTDPSAKGERRANYTSSIDSTKAWTLKPESDWIVTPCPAIVSSEVWDDCNRIIAAQEKKRNKPGRQTVHLLAGYVQCSCGKKMYVFHVQSNLYHCKGCKNKIAVADIDEIYQDQLKAFLLSDGDINNYLDQSAGMIKEKEELLKGVKKEMETLRRRMEELVTMRVNREMSPENFATFYKPLEMRLSQLDDQTPELQSEIDFLKIQSLSSDAVMRQARDLYEQWPTLGFPEKRNIVETITSTIVVGTDDIDISLAFLPPSFQNGGTRERNSIVSLPCSQRQAKVPKRKPVGYPYNPETIGDHIRKKRLDLKIFQKDVAKILGVTEDCITLWEKNHSEPQIQYYPAITKFLGYFSWVIPETGLGGRIKRYRYENGLSLLEMGKLVGSHQTTVLSWEEGSSKPRAAALKVLQEIL